MTALLTSALAVLSWGSGRDSVVAKRGRDGEVENLRVAASIATSDNAALRRELDRLLARQHGADLEAGATGRGKASAAGRIKGFDGGSSAPSSHARLRAHTLAARLERFATGSVDGKLAASRRLPGVILEIYDVGPDAFPEVRDAYLEIKDPGVRALILHALVFGHADEVPRFVGSQLEAETDSALRSALVGHVSRLITPSTAPIFEEGLVRVVSSDADEETRLAAIRALRYSESGIVEKALAKALADPSEKVRMAAVQSLPLRSRTLDMLNGNAMSEASREVKEAARCRLLLAGNGPLEDGRLD
jgi:hypothetical protein